MADVFVGVPGTVAIFTEPDSILPGKITFEDSPSKKFMISGMDYKQSVDSQFQTSMERDVYAYVFGDNIGDAIIHGRAYFPCQVRGGGGGGSESSGWYDSMYMSNGQGGVNGGRTGFDDILDMYASKRMSNYFPPVKITVGSRPDPIKGYLTSLLVKAVGLSDEPSGLVYDFSMTISTLPSSSQGGGSSGS